MVQNYGIGDEPGEILFEWLPAVVTQRIVPCDAPFRVLCAIELSLMGMGRADL